MAAPDGMTLTTDISVKSREMDFVTQFGKQWKRWFDIMGIMRPIEKAPGTTLKSYVSWVDETAPSDEIAEGETVPFTKTHVKEVAHEDLELRKRRKGITAEDVTKYGAKVAIQRTDAAFRSFIFKSILREFYSFMLTGKLKGSKKTWQEALAIARTAVINRFDDADLDVTEVVGFANVMDYGKYLGTADITTQMIEGIQYVENFMGYKTLFLLSDSYIPRKKVVAIPVNNIDMYHINPADPEFKELGLDFTVDPELGLVGFHANGNYANFTGESQAFWGMKLWAEYLDGIAVVEVSATDKDPEVEKVTEPEQGS